VEVDLRYREINWMGVADLVNISGEGCEIVDFKTGARENQYEFQLHIYGLLWARDKDRNPDGRPASRLTLAYGDQAVDVAPLTELESKQFEVELIRRTETATQDASCHPPIARPSVENCPLCPVRHLCDEYWESDTQERLASELVTSARSPNTLHDFEVEVLGRQGPRSWRARPLVSKPLPTDAAIVIRISPEDRIAESVLDHSERVRLVDAFLEDPPDEGPPQPAAIGVSMLTEVFAV
jgi:hypothetical protein